MRNAIAGIPVAIALLGGAAFPDVTHGLAAAVAASRFTVHFLDVGTGDSAIIDIGESEVLIDGGDSVQVLTDDLDRTRIVDGPIELVVLTHADSDHWKGLRRLFGFDGKNANPPAVLEFWEPGYNRDCRQLDSYDTFIDKMEHLPGLREFRRPLQTTHPPAVATGMVNELTIPGVPNVEFRLLHSDSAPESSNNDCPYLINNASIVFSARIFNHRFLFTGDANGKERAEASPGSPGHIEKLLLDLDAAHPGTLRADVLKAPHHGSETASTQAFLDRVAPDFVIVSSSTRHHLPKDTVLDRYENVQAAILKTDLDPKADNDHIICFEDEVQELDCRHAATLNEQ
jgi:competence protein ComEC